MMGGGPPERFGEARAKLEAAFRDAGRKETPRAMSLTYFSLDDDPEAQARSTSATTTRSSGSTPT